MADPYIGEIRLMTCNFAPRNWAFCNGQVIQIAQQTALFAVIGSTYGGNWSTYFNLPDFQCRLAVGAGSGPGLSTWSLGEGAGQETVQLTSGQLNHSHTMRGGTTSESLTDPAGHVTGVTADNHNLYATSASSFTVLHDETVVPVSGGNQPHNNMMPFQCLNFVICLEGNYPPRN